MKSACAEFYIYLLTIGMYHKFFTLIHIWHEFMKRVIEHKMFIEFTYQILQKYL